MVSYTNLTYGLAYFLYHHASINNYLEAQLLGGLTRSGLVTLRFGRIDLTGTDGCPLAFHDADWCYAIKRVTQGLDVIYDQLTATNPGKAHAAASTKASDQGPRTHLSTQHLMLHLHQDKIYGSTDEEVDMISDVFLKIIQRPCYDLAFADPTWHGGTSNLAEVTTTESGEGCLFPL